MVLFDAFGRAIVAYGYSRPYIHINCQYFEYGSRGDVSYWSIGARSGGGVGEGEDFDCGCWRHWL